MTWQVDLLTGIRAQATTLNITILSYWAESEGTPPSWNNWLATEWNGYGGTNANPAGVKAYPTEYDGVEATRATLLLPAYDAVVAAFQQNASAETIYRAINASPWCSGCQGGHYPIALYDWVQSGAVPGSGGAPGPGVPVETVPDVVGMALAKAENTLLAAGLAAGVHQAAPAGYTATVNSQTPGPGARLAEGSTVDLGLTITASAPPAPPQPPPPPPSNSHIDPATLSAWSDLTTVSGPGLDSQIRTLESWGQSIGRLVQ